MDSSNVQLQNTELMYTHKNTKSFVEKWEGPKGNQKNDFANKDLPPELNGWHTIRGVTWGTYKDTCRVVFGRAPEPKHFLGLTPADVETLFVAEFWKPCRANAMESERMAMAVVDFAFNAGIKQSIMSLQKVLNLSFGKNLKVDGIIGLHTISALKSVDDKELFAKYQAERLRFYQYVANKKNKAGVRTQAGFLPGWTNRVNDLTKFWNG